MAKAKLHFVCTECGADYRKWQGQCGQCGAWNSISEFRESAGGVNRNSGRQGFAGQTAQIQSLDDIVVSDTPRISSGSDELDRVLGGGLVAGGVVLVGGHPGAGKSTLLLQTVSRLGADHSVLYVTGEESVQQIAMRAQRLQLPSVGLQVMAETDIEAVINAAGKVSPKILIIDSIQVMYCADLQSAPGSVSQVREAAALLTRYAKQNDVAVLMVGHVTKDGALAGPKVLEHMIDASIMLEGSEDSRFRTLRAIKNRFGAVNELGVFAMLESGLKDVKNPSAIFLNRDEDVAPGSAVTVVWEGTRPLLVELQALVDQAFGASPRRLAVGLDPQRMAMSLAVLHKHGGMHCSDQDVFVNIVGGVKVAETSADLALLMAVASSFRNRVLADDMVIFGEVGLSGEIRPVNSGQERVLEASKHGFRKAIVPKGNVPKKAPADMEVIGVSRLTEALDML